MSRNVILYERLPEAVRQALLYSESAKVLCPACRGGASGEFSLYVRRTDSGAFGKCYRAKCGWHFTTVGGDYRAPKRKNTVYSQDTRPLSSQELDYIASSYGLMPEEIADWTSLGDDWGTIVLPIYGPHGERRGVQTRTLFKKGKICRTYRNADGVLLHWDKIDDKACPTIIVEDQISARKLATLGYRAVALLGTNLDKSQCAEIAEHGLGEVILALDNDAFAKAVQLSNRHRDVLPMGVVLLQQDIKNMNDADITRLFERRLN